MSIDARFTRGSTMRHVMVMTATSAVGLTSLFLVDVANLFYISLLGQTELAAAIGFAGTIQFFMISISIGLAIAATATVSKAVGAGKREEARRLAASAITTLVSVLALAALGVWFMRDAALRLLGAEGEALAVASDFLAIVLPSVPLLGIAMVTSGLLRSVGDARRAMYVTLSGGLFGALLDPFFIFDWGFGLGVDGAAIVSVLARVLVAGVGLWFTLRLHDLIGRIDLTSTLGDARVLLAIAGPAVATQLSTPFGNAYLTRVVADFGDEAVAGWAVVGRVTALAFGGIYALSGAVGPILGQNLGAELFPRIRSAYRDALIFCTIYVLVVWAALYLANDTLIRIFGLTGAGQDVMWGFTHFGAGAFIFTGALFVSNAAYNNLGRPTWSTAFNWTRDLLVIPALAFLIAGSLGAAGVVAIQAAAGLLVGLLAAVTAWRFVSSIDPAKPDIRAFPLPSAMVNPFSSGRSAQVTITEASQ
ncbi:MAG: MATE family efflux transporter, partial [Pseudomonadota bacterium]